MARDNYDFFFLGCWNNDDEDFDHRKQVLDLIEANTRENEYDFGLFLGDNIYKTKLPEKKISKTEGAPAERISKGATAEIISKGATAERISKGAPAERISKVNRTNEEIVTNNSRGGSRKKKMKRRKKTKKIRGGGKGKKNKVFNKATFDFLVYMIRKGNIGSKPIYFINGNHDIEDCIPDQIEKIKTSLKFDNLIPNNEVILPGLPIKYTNQNYIMIFLDTNNGISRFLHVELSKILKEEGFNKWIILCGHIPLGSVKMKRADASKKGTVTQSLKTLDTVMKALANTGYRKFLYLCADTHNFQVNEIVDNLEIKSGQLLLENQNHKVKGNNINSINNVSDIPDSDLRIPEIVAGTGGADPDFVEAITYPFHHPLRNSRRNNKIGLICHMYKPSYGFCDIKIGEKLVSVRYHQLVGNEEIISEVFIQNKNSRENSNILFSKPTEKVIELIKRDRKEVKNLCEQPK